MTRHFIDTDIASEAEAIAGESNVKLITPLRLAQAGVSAPSPVSITGTAEVGEVLTALLAPGWSVTGYQWTRDGSDISGSTDSTYTLVSADASTNVSVRVTGLSYSATAVAVAAEAGAFDLTGLVAWYDLSDASDSHASSLNLTPINSPTFGEGKIGNAAYLNGSNQSFERATEEALDITAELSVGAWVYLTNTPSSGGNAGVIAKFLGSGNQRSYNLAIDTNRHVRWILSSNGVAQSENVVVADATPLALNTWHFIGGVFVPSVRQSIYVNGAMVKEKTSGVIASINNSTAPLTVGRQFDTDARSHFPGRLDSAFLFSRELSGVEFSALYNSGNGLDYAGLS